jgi:hypothetical protein
MRGTGYGVWDGKAQSSRRKAERLMALKNAYGVGYSGYGVRCGLRGVMIVESRMTN